MICAGRSREQNCESRGIDRQADGPGSAAGDPQISGPFASQQRSEEGRETAGPDGPEDRGGEDPRPTGGGGPEGKAEREAAP